MEESSSTILQQLLGQLLRSVEGLFFIPLGESTLSLDGLDQVRITLGSQSVRFRCSGDGETLRIDGSELCPSDLGEYGELRRADLSQEPMFIGLMGTRLLRILILNSYENKVVGFILESESGSVVICNWGDELKIWDRVPESLFADEGIQISPA